MRKFRRNIFFCFVFVISVLISPNNCRWCSLLHGVLYMPECCKLFAFLFVVLQNHLKTKLFRQFNDAMLVMLSRFVRRTNTIFISRKRFSYMHLDTDERKLQCVLCVMCIYILCTVAVLYVLFTTYVERQNLCIRILFCLVLLVLALVLVLSECL